MVPFFDVDFGLPTKELYTVLGVLILQQMKDLYIPFHHGDILAWQLKGTY